MLRRSSWRTLECTLVLASLMGPAAGAQKVAEKRAKSDVSIPLKKEEQVPTPPKPPVTVLVPGTKREVLLPPERLVSDIVLTEAGPGTVIVERAPVASSRGLPWFPLLGLLGAGILASNLDHGNGGGGDTPPTVIPEVPPTTPPTTPP